MAPYHSGKAFYYRLMEPAFHTVFVHTPFALFHETTNGPFDPADTEFPAWAPPEGESNVVAYVERLRKELRR
jgi:hypothetical protein